MIQDQDKIERTVLPADPSFRGIRCADIDLHIEDARQHALANTKDEFLLSLMQLLALPGERAYTLDPEYGHNGLAAEVCDDRNCRALARRLARFRRGDRWRTDIH